MDEMWNSNAKGLITKISSRIYTQVFTDLLTKNSESLELNTIPFFLPILRTMQTHLRERELPLKSAFH